MSGFNHISLKLTRLLAMPHCLSPSTFHLPSIGRLGQLECHGAPRESRRQRYVFSVFAVSYQILSKLYGATDNVDHPSTSLTTIHFSMYFITVVQFSSMKTKPATIRASYWAENGAVNAGGTSSRTFVDDGGSSYSRRRPTLACALFARMAHPWRRC